MPRQIPSLTLVDARALIAAGEKKAEQPGVPYEVTMVDAGGGLIARAFDMPTEKLAKMESGKPAAFESKD